MNQKFEQKDFDIEGMETLQVIAKADKLNRWMYDTIAPACKGNILEIGSGIGNISQFFLNAGSTITLSDLRNNYIQILRENFQKFPNLKGVINLDLVALDFNTRYAHLFGAYDAVYALNVVEHIENDTLAIANCRKLLKENGSLVILVPAYQYLYNRFDKELEHYKRYTSQQLNELFKKNNFRITDSKYFNMVGIVGWFFSGRILNKKTIPSGHIKLYNVLVPVFKLVDKLFLNKIGLSVITFGRK